MPTLTELIDTQRKAEEAASIAAQIKASEERVKTRRDLGNALTEKLGKPLMDALHEAGLQEDPTHDGNSLVLIFEHDGQRFVLSVWFRKGNSMSMARELAIRLSVPNTSYEPGDEDQSAYDDIGEVWDPSGLISLLSTFTPR
jgi:hypothetical protein